MQVLACNGGMGAQVLPFTLALFPESNLINPPSHASKVKVGLLAQPKPLRAKSKWVIQLGGKKLLTEPTWNRSRPESSEEFVAHKIR